jgi:hypothetical protein
MKKTMLRLATGVLVMTVWAGVPQASAQVAVTSADIERLQDRIFEANSAVAALRSRDADRADRLQAELDEIREEVIYLRVKRRKEGSVSRTEYSALRDRIEDVRTRAAGEPPRETPPPQASRQQETGAAQAGKQKPTRANEIPVGQELDVRLLSRLGSDTAEVEDRFEATTVVDLISNGQVLVPAGSVVRGVVSSVDRAGRVDRRGRLTLGFDRLTVENRSYPLRATVTRAIESEGIRGETGRIGTGAGVGAVIGGILGGFRGVLAGILIGAGGTIAATEGNDVVLPQGTILRLRFDAPLVVE